MYKVLRAADTDNDGMLNIKEIVLCLLQHEKTKRKNTQLRRRLAIAMGLVFLMIAILLGVSFAVGFTLLDVDKSDTKSVTSISTVALATRSERIVGTRDQKTLLPLFVAPVLDQERLASVNTLWIEAPDPDTNLRSNLSARVQFARVFNDTAMFFQLESGDKVCVWNGKAYINESEGVQRGLCFARAECAALVLDSVSEADELHDKADKALIEAGFMAPSQSTRQLQASGDSCVYARDGNCDDPGLCDVGTDYTDCCKKEDLDLDDGRQDCTMTYLNASAKVVPFNDYEAQVLMKFAFATYAPFHLAVLRAAGLTLGKGSLSWDETLIYMHATRQRMLTLYVEATTLNGLSTGTIVVACRGSYSIMQWILQFRGLYLAPIFTDKPECAEVEGKEPCMVLNAAKKGVESVVDRVIENVESLRASYPGAPVVVTGHSAGGNYGRVLAAHLKFHGAKQSPPWKLQRVVTFGEPYGGNQRFADLFDSNTYIRVTTKGDPVVPLLGALSLFGQKPRHGGSEVYYEFVSAQVDSLSDNYRETAASLLKQPLAKLVPSYTCQDDNSRCCFSRQLDMAKISPLLQISLRSSSPQFQLPNIFHAHFIYMATRFKDFEGILLGLTNDCDSFCEQEGYGGGSFVYNCRLGGKPSCKRCRGFCVEKVDDSMLHGAVASLACLWHNRRPSCCCDRN